MYCKEALDRLPPPCDSLQIRGGEMPKIRIGHTLQSRSPQVLHRHGQRNCHLPDQSCGFSKYHYGANRKIFTMSKNRSG